jgi:hypothetical protein
MAKRGKKEISETKKEEIQKKEIHETRDVNAREINSRNSSLMTLLVLLIIFFCINLIVIVYFLFSMGSVDSKSNINKPLIDTNLKCKDGTLYGECSKDKPYYCFDGELLKKAATCSCPKGYKVDFQDCVKV